MKSGYLCIFFTVFLLSSPSVLCADPKVFKWEDKKGTVIYSSKAADPDAEIADLPPIMRGEVKLTESKLVSCKDHGGVDCQAGPDSDGSVICLDGFTDASARFRFNCNSPKLSIADISDLLDNGTFTVLIRNSKSVTAKDPVVEFRSPTGKKLRLNGPGEIEPYGLAEFYLDPLELNDDLIDKPQVAQLLIDCINCS